MSVVKKERVKQVPKFMQATVSCGQQSILYGQCIMKHYQNMSKDACAAEFSAYKKCVQTVLSRKW
ncbi:unnamed protein product [Kuraishia capsulata CBS 1993]|uniref:CHCH domain-containing protein n=1 Tax=Kuraishia capsulata CBS 1993 TaxID=1382522 RepID=W6MV10_9ASCO|nr:uncharacterized protein KUCA_T00005700001 [Kuraishia capsulata CBS 1993]CDK29707.1 unnamed protein product [Kuraishia capsulata CBS 1993]